MGELVFWVAAGLAAAGFGCWIWRKEREWRRIERLLEALAAGRELPPSISANNSRFAETIRLIAKIAGHHDALLRETHDSAYNLRAILGALDDGIAVADHRQLITFVNPALLHIFSLKVEPIGQSVLTTLRQPLLKTMLDGVFEEGAPQQGEIELTGGGREAPLQLIASATPLRDAAGRPGAVLVFRDVSRLRRLEEIRREFVANVSHELRTPLSIFHGYVETLLETPQPTEDELRGSLEIMQKHALRLNALVEDLLTLTRLESKRDALKPEPVEICQLLRQTIADWQRKARAAEVALNLEGTTPATLQLDVLKFQQVLGNLLENALKFTAPGGEITLSSRVVDKSLEICVADTGAGIPREDLPHIFERFYRADKSRTRELGGTGLGLAIVKHIVQAHGGTVYAESELEKGTRICIRLPLA